MPGNISGQIDCLYGATSDWKSIQEQFVSMYKFLKYVESQGPIEEIASYYGVKTTTTGYVPQNIHAAIASDNAAPVTTGLTDPPVPHIIQAVFSALWDGGDIEIIGTDTLDAPQTETLISNPGGTRVGVSVWKTITSINNTVVGSGLYTVTVQAHSVGYGMAYWDQNLSAGEGSFAVFRWKRAGEMGTTTTRTHSWYLLLQWIRGTSQGGAGLTTATPISFSGYDTYDTSGTRSIMGIQTAIGDNGSGTDQSPWAGSSNADGSDTKANPVWDATLVTVLPRHNSTGGVWSISKQGLAMTAASQDGAPIVTRANFYADDDNFAFYQERNGTNNWAPTILGPYTPMEGLTIAIPHVMAMTGFYNPTRLCRGDFVYGSNPATCVQGGVATADFSLQGTNLYCSSLTYDEALAAVHQPTKQTTPNKLSAFPLVLLTYEPGIVNGLVGEFKTPLCRQTSYCSTYDQNATFTRIAYGFDGTTSSVKSLAPWDGTTPVGSVLTRDGVQYNAAP